MKKLAIFTASAGAYMLAASAALAQVVNPAVGTTGNNLKDILKTVGEIISSSIAILITLALAVFFWGLVKYLFKLGSDEGTKGKDLMLYGIVALFVMVSVWGLVQFIQSFFGIGVNSQTIPTQNLIPQRTQ